MGANGEPLFTQTNNLIYPYPVVDRSIALGSNIGGGQSTTATSSALIFLNGSTTGNSGYSWINSGNVGIGTTSPSSKLSVIGTMTVGNSGDNYDVVFNSDLAGNSLQWDANYGAGLDGSLIFNYANSPTRAWDAVMPGIKFIPPTDPAGALTAGLFLNFEDNDAYGNRLDLGWGGANGGNFELYSKNHDTRPGEFRIVYGGGDYGLVQFTHYDGVNWFVNSGVSKDGRWVIGLKDSVFPGTTGSSLPAPAYPLSIYNEGTTEIAHVTTAGNLQLDGVLNIDGAGDSYIQGNLGIGTTSPTEKLTIGGNLSFTSNGGAGRTIAPVFNSQDSLYIAGGATCFSAETLITTPGGSIRISDLHKGDTVISYDPDSKTYSQSAIQDIYVRDVNGYFILNNLTKVTEEHPFYTSNGWVKVKDLHINDLLFTPRDGSDCMPKIGSTNLLRSITCM